MLVYKYNYKYNMCTCDWIIVPTNVFVVPHISEVKLDALANHSLLRRRGSAVEHLVYLCTWKRPNRIPAVTVKQPNIPHVVLTKHISYSLVLYEVYSGHKSQVTI